MRLRQRAQDHELRKLASVPCSEALRRRELDVRLVDHDQRAALERVERCAATAASSSALPVGLFGEHRNTSFTVGVAGVEHALRRRARSRARRAAAPSRTSAPWMRAATAYMPKVGGQMSTSS